MRCLLLILGLVALVRAQGPAGWASLISARADANEMRLAGLRTRIDAIANKLSGVGSGVSTDSLAARVRRLTGNGCRDSEFQCGGDAPQCVNNLQVCDGTPDCRNTADEGAVCNVPISQGSSWVGVAYWTSCNSVGTSNVRIIINKVNRASFFTARTTMDVTVIHEQNGQYAMETTTGWYGYGARRVFIAPTGGKHIGLQCDFDGVNMRRCEGRLVSDSQATCADIVMARR